MTPLRGTRGRSRPRADLLIRRADELVTLSAFADRPAAGAVTVDELSPIADGAVAVSGDRILAVGTTAEVESHVSWGDATRVFDARGRAVIPGMVDSHTHCVYAGDRAVEWARRRRGESYLSILASGGGILETVRTTRQADAGSLVAVTAARLQRMIRHGATTIEVKSGYALTPEGELRLLEVARACSEMVPALVVETFLGAHAVPPEYRDRPDDYVRAVVDVMLPEVARRAPWTRFCDVFCEPGVFSATHARAILQRAAELGLRGRVHVDEFAWGGGAKVAAELGAASCDHVDHTPIEELELLARSGVVATLLPGVALFTGSAHRPDVDAMRRVGLPVALATDHNPGTCPAESMATVAALGCAMLGLSPEEALVAVTINPAHSLGLAREVGSLEAGKRADLVVLSGPSYLHLPYRLGADAVDMVVAGGQPVAAGG